MATLDKCKVSDRDAVRIIIAVAESLKHNIDELVINRSSIRRKRFRLRAERAVKLREAFQKDLPKFVTVHWDGKLLPSLTGKEQVERLPVIITYEQSEKLLGVPKISKSSGRQQALAVFDLLEEWDLSTRVQAICCDTTASNMGRFQGACVLLEQMIERDLLYFPCRHHIYEIVLKSVFENKIAKSSGPEVTIFKGFQKAWPKIDQTNFQSSINDQYVREKLQDVELTLEFCLNTLKEKHPRDDYKEFLEVMITFLGGTRPGGNSFRMPGAFHQARWMAKAIYVLKIYLFREQYVLSSNDMLGIKDLCIFLANLYIQPWFNAPIPEVAPRQDFEFLKKLYKYKDVDENISSVGLQKFSGHLWYLTPECAALSFFDKAICPETKRRMAEHFNNTQLESVGKKVVITKQNIEHYINLGIETFISIESKKLFDRFDISIAFLEKDPLVWENEISYIAGLKKIQNLKIVNDTAERGVKLMTDYNNLLTKDETNKQYILQVLEEYRKRYPTATKSSLMY